MVCSVLLLDTDGVHVRLGAAPSLPDDYVRAHSTASQWAASVGSCGTVMQVGRPVIVTDIVSLPIRTGTSCATRPWPVGCAPAGRPILSPQKKVLGSFAMYCDTPRGPSREELRLIETAADLAGAAIDHHRSQEALRQSEERNRAILRAIPDWMFVMSSDGVFLDYHVKNPEALLAPPEAFLGKSMPRRPARRGSPTPISARSNGPWRPTSPSDSSTVWSHGHERRFYEACIVRCDSDRCSASCGTSPTASAPSWMRPRNARSSRI